jgi:hypothetical protein
MAGLRNSGIDLSNQSVVPSAGTTAGHWTIFAQAGGIFATDDVGNVQPLSNASVDVASASAHALLLANMYTDGVVAATSATLETEFTALVATTSGQLYAFTDAASANAFVQASAFTAAASANALAQSEAYTDGVVAATSAALYAFTDAASANALTQATAYTDTSVADISAVIDGNYVHRTGAVAETIDGAKIFTDMTTFNSDVVVQGTIFAASGTFAVIAGVVSANSNLIELNVGDPGPGVTRGFAGVQIDRGTEVPYQFLFDENRDAFVVGTINGPVSGGAGTIREMQVVATREDAPVDKAVPFWKTGTPSTCGGYLFVTDGQFTYDAVTGLTVNDIVYTPSTPADWAPAPAAVFPALDQLAARISAVSGSNSDLYAVIAATSATLETEFTALVATTSGQLYAHTDAASANALAQANAFTVAASANALAQAEAYTDAEVAAVSASLYAFTVAASANALAQAEAYTDAEVAAVSASLYAFTVAASANALVQAESYTDSVSASIAQNVVAMMQGGTVNADTTNYVYTISHNDIGSVAAGFPIVSLTVPASSSVLYVQGISDRTTTSFNVVLSDVPDAAGYAINWVLFKPYGT